ncbi:surfeit locus protein 6 homolog [Euwallacea fornicatus]|uniref:surfeit locus protein 6 homolog n=1 Tax=Euwallacea fornicatus TaxID=995702 RepID=UPI00338DF0A4
MELSKTTKKKFDQKKLELFLLDQNKFILTLFSVCGLPERTQLDEETNEDAPLHPPLLINETNKKTRAKSLHELEERLNKIRSKKKLSYKEKLTKKNLKNKMKKKNKQDVRNAKSKLERAAKMTLKNKGSTEEVSELSIKKTEEKVPVFNAENKLVFSKIDFANLGKQKVKKQEKNPEKILKKLTEEKNKLDQLEYTGETTKMVQIKEKTAWKNALAKAEGQKIKDDPILLKKSMKKKEQKVRASKKKWEARITGVAKAKEDKQKRRKDNIDQRKKQKKVKELKRATKRGKIIAGF